DSEDALIDQAKRRNYDALSALINLHYQAILGDLHLRFPSLNGTCEEIVRGLSTKLWKWNGLSDLHAPVLPLLITADRNEARSVLRRHKHECPLDESTLRHATTPSPEADVFQRDQLAKVMQAIDHPDFPAEEADAITAVLEGLDYKEAAQKQQCSVAAWYARFNRGIARLRRRFSSRRATKKGLN